ncbi:MAG: hypothetical protein HYX24_05955 [Candidatus Aenigmarchaeota archaeon]|nr:hypothetical protein [Candidatus Aenigmarchaeota archaeon]
MKAQSGIISTVLITGILITLVGVTYFWGVPLIEKQSLKTQFDSATSFMKELDTAVAEVANSGGNKELNIPLGTLRIDPDAGGKNSATLEFFTGQPIVEPGNEVYLGDVTFEDIEKQIGVFGKSKAGLTSMIATKAGETFKISFTLRYRELDDQQSGDGYKISLAKGLSSAGTKKLTIKAGGREVKKGMASSGGDLILTLVNLEVT